MMGSRCPGLVAESLPEVTPLGASLLLVIPRGRLGVQREVPMFGRVAQNSGGCRGWGS